LLARAPVSDYSPSHVLAAFLLFFVDWPCGPLHTACRRDAPIRRGCSGHFFRRDGWFVQNVAVPMMSVSGAVGM
jgi:hypothetical protein